jgi:hypothetical protein
VIGRYLLEINDIMADRASERIRCAPFRMSMRMGSAPIHNTS